MKISAILSFKVERFGILVFWVILEDWFRKFIFQFVREVMIFL